MATEMTKAGESFALTPRNMTEAIEFSKLIAGSAVCPQAFQRKPGDVLVAVQMGMEVGLAPMQALQNIAVINGRPTVWGDAALAIVQRHPRYVRHEERNADEALRAKEGRCTVYRKEIDGAVTEHTQTFSLADAERAGLVKRSGASGPWSTYPGRMLQMRARSWALRDAFPDALRGLAVREEAEDYDVLSTQPDGTEIVMPRRVEAGAADEAMAQLGSGASSGASRPQGRAGAQKPGTSDAGEFRVVSVEEITTKTGKTFWRVDLADPETGEVRVGATTFSESLRDTARDCEGQIVEASIEHKESKGRTYTNLKGLAPAGDGGEDIEF